MNVCLDAGPLWIMAIELNESPCLNKFYCILPNVLVGHQQSRACGVVLCIFNCCFHFL